MSLITPKRTSRKPARPTTTSSTPPTPRPGLPAKTPSTQRDGCWSSWDPSGACCKHPLVSRKNGKTVTMGFAASSADKTEFLAALATEGKFKPHIEHVYPFEDIVKGPRPRRHRPKKGKCRCCHAGADADTVMVPPRPSRFPLRFTRPSKSSKRARRPVYPSLASQLR